MPQVQTIIKKVKALKSGGEGIEIAKVDIDDGNQYPIEFKYDSSVAEAGTQEFSEGKFIITRKKKPDTKKALKDITDTLYIKPDGSGGYTIGTDETNAKQLKCAETLFGKATAGDCTKFNFKIINQVKGLTNGAEQQVAVVPIEGKDYKIICKQGSDKDAVIDNTAGSEKITIEKADWSSVNTDASLQDIIKGVKIGGTKSSPEVAASGGTALDCSSINFAIETNESNQCQAVTGLPKTILDDAKELTTDDNTATVAKVEIGSDKTLYDIILKKVSGAPGDPTIDTGEHKITVEVQITPQNNEDITTAIGTIKIGGTASAPVYDGTGKDITCPTNFDKAKSPVTCNPITLPTEEVQEIIDSVPSGDRNEKNVEVLKNMDIASKFTPEEKDLEKAVIITIAESSNNMDAPTMEKVVDSYKMIDTQPELTAENVDQATDCIMDGICN